MKLKIKLKILSENIICQFNIKIVSKKNNKMIKRFEKKDFLLIIVNVPSQTSDKTADFIKNIKMKECKHLSLYSSDLNLIENI